MARQSYPLAWTLSRVREAAFEKACDLQLRHLGIYVRDLKRDRYPERGMINKQGIVWFGGSAWSNAPAVHWQFVVPDRHPGFAIRLDHDDEPLHLHLGVGLFTLFAGIDARWAKKLRDYFCVIEKQRGEKINRHYTEREISVRFHNKSVWWTIWMPPDESSSRDPRWRRGAWHPLDTLLGCGRYEDGEILKTERVMIPLHEGQYPATVQLQRRYWRRARWPWPIHTYTSAEITLDKDAPEFAGKGEESWQMEDDAISRMSTIARTVGEAIGEYVGAVLRNRERYGMPDGLDGLTPTGLRDTPSGPPDPVDPWDDAYVLALGHGDISVSAARRPEHDGSVTEMLMLEPGLGQSEINAPVPSRPPGAPVYPTSGAVVLTFTQPASVDVVIAKLEEIKAALVEHPPLA